MYKYIKPITFKQTRTIYYIKAIEKNTNRLKLIWYIKNDNRNKQKYQLPIIKFINYLIKSETHLSFINYLKYHKIWINNITTDIFYDGYYCKGSALIIQSTKKCNINNIHQIIRYFYDYINLLLTASKVYINNDIIKQQQQRKKNNPYHQNHQKQIFLNNILMNLNI